MKTDVMDSWGKYLRAKEPGVREKAYAWKTPKGEQVGEQARTDAIRQLAAAIPHPHGGCMV